MKYLFMLFVFLGACVHTTENIEVVETQKLILVDKRNEKEYVVVDFLWFHVPLDVRDLAEPKDTSGILRTRPCVLLAMELNQMVYDTRRLEYVCE